jgi:hypothetical protein
MRSEPGPGATPRTIHRVNREARNAKYPSPLRKQPTKVIQFG